MKKYLLIFAFCLIAFSANAGECDFIQFNKCRSCDELLAYQVASPDACDKLCPNREVNTDLSGSRVIYYNCFLKECPAEYPYRDWEGNCFASVEASAEYHNRPYKGEDDELEGEYITAPKVIDGKCPPDRPMLYSDRCFTCNEPGLLSASEEDCNKCPNRKYTYYPHWGVGICYIPCPPDKPLMRWDGKCFTCNEPRVVNLPTYCNIEGNCEDWCPNRMIIYTIGGNIPSVMKCPPDKPLMDSSGFCFPCDTPLKIGVDDDVQAGRNNRFCQQACPDTRHLSGDLCVLNEK